MNNIIFGLYAGYKSLTTTNGGILYFMKSLRKYNDKCKVVVFCEKIDMFDELETFSKEMNFEIYNDFTSMAEVSDSTYNHERDRWAWPNFFGSPLDRNILCKKYLDNTNEIFNKIYLLDMNDLIFQDDPFSIEFTEDLYCALEGNPLIDNYNCSSRTNMEWINKCDHLINYNTYHNYHGKFVVCHGTLLGTDSGIRTYLNFYSNTEKIKPVVDQGVLNVYVYNYLNSKQIINYRRSKILTLDRISFDNLNIDSNDDVINDNGEKYAIIHQINRCNLPFFINKVSK